jgi:N6-L-threonylcarbamoyladenine synthase
MSHPFYTLGIETSCDEAAVAILRDEAELLVNLVYSQANLHARYGGVVPEIASRDHLRKLPFLIKDAFIQAKFPLREVSLVAATYGPGLMGPLLVGLSYAKGTAFGLNIPFIGVNHLEGHIFAHRLHPPFDPPPFMALIVSGGHTLLVSVKEYGHYQVIGSTVDDASGEALDKVGKMLGISYPAGSTLDRLAQQGDPTAVRFPRPMASSAGFDFSFAGLKTAVLYHLRKHPREKPENVAAAFVASIVDILSQKALEATRRYHLKRLIVVGGVAANTQLRQALLSRGGQLGIAVHFPPTHLCTDNAAMIAAAGAFHHRQLGESHPLSLAPDPSLSLERTP